MLLVTPKRNPGPAGRLANWLTRRRLGRTIEPVQLALHHPRLLFAMGASEQAVDGCDALDDRLKALVNLRAAWGRFPARGSTARGSSPGLHAREPPRAS